MKQYQNRYIFSSDIMRRQKRAKRRMFFVLAVLLFLVLALFMGNIMTSHRVVVEDLRVGRSRPRWVPGGIPLW